MDIDFIAQRIEDFLDLLHRKLMRRFEVFVFTQCALRHFCADRELPLADTALLAQFTK